VAFRPVAAELACVRKVAPWGGGSEVGPGDEGCFSGGEGCFSGGGGEGRGGEGVDGGASGGGAVDFGKGVPAEMLPVVGGILGGDGGGRITGGGGDVRSDSSDVRSDSFGPRRADRISSSIHCAVICILSISAIVSALVFAIGRFFCPVAAPPVG